MSASDWASAGFQVGGCYQGHWPLQPATGAELQVRGALQRRFAATPPRRYPIVAATPFASACSAIRSPRAFSRGTRISPLSTAHSSCLPVFRNQCPFAPPELPNLSTTTGQSATLPVQACARRFPAGACALPKGLSLLPLLPSCAHAAVNTPSETAGAHVARFPTTDNSLVCFWAGT